MVQIHKQNYFKGSLASTKLISGHKVKFVVYDLSGV